MAAERTYRTALFVDFDNIYLGLKDVDEDLAEAFANRPEAWLAALGADADADGAFRRRFLVRSCYLNPVTFGRFRPFFVRAGFRVVDCPPLTARGKNSADIHIVLDVMDALRHETRYDEFVIASADADFTPVLARLRAHDRRTSVVTAGPAAPAYTALCDTVISPDDVAEALVGRGLAAAPARPAAARRPAAGAIDRVADAIRATVAKGDRPILAARAAQAALEVDPHLADSDWLGAGSFGDFVERHTPELTLARDPAPGFLYDARRHNASDVPGAQRGSSASLEAQVASVTGAPLLTSGEYRVVFEELAADLAAHPYHLNDTAKRVRDRCVARECVVGRGPITFVLQGLRFAQAPLTAATTADDLAAGWTRWVIELTTNARMELSEEDLTAVRRWLAG